MANSKHVALVTRRDWNEWRAEHPHIIPNLRKADLSDASLTGADLTSADLFMANLTDANLTDADLTGANLTGANLTGANLTHANLTDADLTGANLNIADLTGANLNIADLTDADLTGANLSRAHLRGAHLGKANLNMADLSEADLTTASLVGTIFGETDLRGAKGLAECDFEGPCILDIRTIQKSGMLPVPFLRGCGLPDLLIDYLPSLLHEAIQFFSCFISYSTRDQEFADRVHADLQNKGVRCWFAPHDIRGGRKVHEQIDEAIRLYDKLLVILSEASMASKWVETEIRKAFAKERRENTRVLFPLALVPFEQVSAWVCFDSDSGEDLARKVREYFIPDFSRWKDHDPYTKAFERLLRDLKDRPQDKATAQS